MTWTRLNEAYAAAAILALVVVGAVLWACAVVLLFEAAHSFEDAFEWAAFAFIVAWLGMGAAVMLAYADECLCTLRGARRQGGRQASHRHIP